MLFCPGREPFGHRESSLFAEPTENKSFSEKKPVFFSTKLEMILIFMVHGCPPGHEDYK
jgi:hypothetical protein